MLVQNALPEGEGRDGTGGERLRVRAIPLSLPIATVSVGREVAELRTVRTATGQSLGDDRPLGIPMAGNEAGRDRVSDPLIGEPVHQPAIDFRGLVPGDGIGKTRPLQPLLDLLKVSAVPRKEADFGDERQGIGGGGDHSPPQYSSANMTVRTRTVTFGSAGSGE